MASRNRYNSFGAFSGELSNQQHQAVREPTAGAVVDVFHTIIITLLWTKGKWLATIVTIGYCYTIVTIAPFRGFFGMFYHLGNRALVTGTFHEALQGFHCLRIFGPYKLQSAGSLMIENHCTDILLYATTIHARMRIG